MLQGDVVTQGLVVIEILIAQDQAEDTLANQRFRAVQAELRITFIIQSASYRTRQPHLTIELTQQQNAAVGGDVAAIEAGENLTAFAAWKGGGGHGTFYHGGCIG